MTFQPAHKDTMTPAGQIINRVGEVYRPTKASTSPQEPLEKRVTWGRPLRGTETPEEAYCRGWADAIAKYESDKKALQEYNKHTGGVDSP